MKHRNLIFCFIAVMALGLMGYGYAAWSSNVATNAQVTTGTMQIGISPTSTTDATNPTSDLVWNGTAAVSSPLGERVGTTTIAPAADSLFTAGTAATPYYGQVNLTYNNIYPDYASGYTVDLYNNGTIPVKLNAPAVIWSNPDVQTDYDVYSWTVTDTDTHAVAPVVTVVTSGTTYADLVTLLSNYKFEPQHDLTINVNAYFNDSNGTNILLQGKTSTETISFNGTQFNS
jgi:hypothetical protein